MASQQQVTLQHVAKMASAKVLLKIPFTALVELAELAAALPLPALENVGREGLACVAAQIEGGESESKPSLGCKTQLKNALGCKKQLVKVVRALKQIALKKTAYAKPLFGTETNIMSMIILLANPNKGTRIKIKTPIQVNLPHAVFSKTVDGLVLDRCKMKEVTFNFGVCSMDDGLLISNALTLIHKVLKLVTKLGEINVEIKIGEMYGLKLPVYVKKRSAMPPPANRKTRKKLFRSG
jgi:hypothetical protein